MDYQTALEQLQVWIITYSVKILISIIILVIGWIVIKKSMKIMRKVFQQKSFDPSLVSFTYSLLSIALKILLILTVLGILGVPMTTFIALIGAFGLAVGLALQGSLSNFAGGVLILSFKPFEVGDVVQIGSNIGSVSEIQIFNSVLINARNETIIVPNATASNTEIINFTRNGERRLDLQFGIAYESNLEDAKKALSNAVSQVDTVIRRDETQVVVVNLGDSSVDLELRVWVNSSDYMPTKDKLIEEVKISLDNAKVEIPYPKTELISKE
jgi:small conductance mechanosensitive channel